MIVNLDDETAEILIQLAYEEGISPARLVTNLIKRMDEARHVQFQPGKGHVRVRCDSPRCKEKEARSTKPIYGD